MKIVVSSACRTFVACKKFFGGVPDLVNSDCLNLCFSCQSERSTSGGGLFLLQSKIGLSIDGTGNLIFDRKIRIKIG